MIYGDSLEYKFVTLQPILTFHLMFVKNIYAFFFFTFTGRTLDSCLSRGPSSFQLITAKPWTWSTIETGGT